MAFARFLRKPYILGLLVTLCIVYYIHSLPKKRIRQSKDVEFESLMKPDYQDMKDIDLPTASKSIFPKEPPSKPEEKESLTTSNKQSKKAPPSTAQITKPKSSYDGKYEEPTPDLIQSVTDNQKYEEALERFEAPMINFLPNYRNPCWFELVDIATAYKHNFFSTLESSPYLERYISSFNIMKGTLEQRIRKAKATGSRKTWRIRCLPYFYMIGTPRSGTTDLFSALTTHPLLMSGEYKEPTYWNRLRHPHPVKPWMTNPKIDNIDILETPREVEMELQGNFRGLNHYVESFDRQAEKIRVNDLEQTIEGGPPFHPAIFGDCSPSYIWDFDAWDELAVHEGHSYPTYTVADYIRNTTPKAKMIILLRNPVMRLYSEYKAFLTRQSKSPKLFHNKAIAAVIAFEDCASKNDFMHCLHNFTINTQPDFAPLRIRIGLYSKYIADWFKRFPRNQFYINTMEEYKENSEAVLKEIYEFLELDDLPESAYKELAKKKIVNSSGPDAEEMMPQTFNLLSNFYQPWNDELATLLNDDKYRWQS